MNPPGIISFPQGNVPWQVRALGAIRRNDGDTNNHTIEVFLAPLSHPVIHDYFHSAFAPLGLLPALRIGSVWKDQRLEPGEPTQLGDTFRVKLTAGTGEIVRAPDHAALFTWHWALPPDIRDRGYFVETPGECHLGEHLENCTVVFPCPVAFGHFYAGTSNLAVLLCRHPPSGKSPNPDEAWKRIYFLERQEQPGLTEYRSFYLPEDRRVHVCLASCVEDAGYRYAAWFYHEEQARREAQAIPNRLTTAPGDELTGHHLRIGLPFASGTELECYGAWDPHTCTLLIHRVVRCDYRLAETEIVTFDRENDARRANRMPPGTRWLEQRAGGAEAPPRKEAAQTPPEGGTVSMDPPLGDQEPLIWEVADPMELFGCEGGKVEKACLRTKDDTLTPPMLNKEVDELLGCGEKAYTAKAKPGLLVQPPDPPSATALLASMELLSELRGKREFDYILAVLRLLRSEGWLAERVRTQGLLLDFNTQADPALRGGQILAAKLVRNRTRVLLIEFAHRLSATGDMKADTATILAWPREQGPSPPLRDLLNEILAGLGTWKEIKPVAEKQGWQAVAFDHQSRRVGAPVGENFTLEESVRHHAGKLLKFLHKREAMEELATV